MGSLEESIKEMLRISFIDGNDFRIKHLYRLRLLSTRLKTHLALAISNRVERASPIAKKT